MNAEDLILARLSEDKATRSEVGAFLGMSGTFGRVLLSAGAVSLPVQAEHIPRIGDTVRVVWMQGAGVIVGAATPRPITGTVSAIVGSRLDVSAGGTTYRVPYVGAAPVLGDLVALLWGDAGGVCLGKLSASPVAPTTPTVPTPAATPLSSQVRAEQSARWLSRWIIGDPWAGDGWVGLWTYGRRLVEAFGTATVTHADVFLPLATGQAAATVALMPGSASPGSAPAPAATFEAVASGWVPIPDAWLSSLFDDVGYGIGILGGGVKSTWAGVLTDPASGAVRVTGTR